MTRSRFAPAVAMFLAAAGALAAAGQPTRNPFKVKDVFDPDGEDVKAFAAKAKIPGGPKDANAPQWAEAATAGKKGLLDGEWYSRWKGGSTAGDKWITGTAQVKTVENRVYILFSDKTSTYLIELRRDGPDRLVGRYVNNAMPKKDNSPWVGRVIDDERIDGIWSDGRWDLRRKIADK